MKNYFSIYNSQNDSSALEQRFYLKLEAVSGVMETPGNDDHFLHLPGGSIAFEQPFESSPQRSGRHHSSIIKKKKISSFSFSTYFNIDEAAIDGKSSIDTAIKVLWKSLLGREDISGASAIYDAVDQPSITFSLAEVGDLWARFTPGAFINSGTVSLPGDGEATTEFSGNGSTTYIAGLAKSTVDNNLGNDVTVQAGEGAKFTVGAIVMLIEADGTTRSADTPDEASRTITAIVGDVVTLSGAVLADADGGAADILLCYYEAPAPTAVNNPVTGLVGSVSIAGLPSQCIRQLQIAINNNHELIDYCYGTDGLGEGSFVAGSRVTSELTLDMNLNHEVLAFFNGLLEFGTEDIDAVLGDIAGRHFAVDLPSARFQVPGFTVPDEGSIPVSFTGQAYESSLGAADELTISFN